MRIYVEQIQDQRFRVTAGESTLVVDLPANEGGHPGSFRSGELFIASLGACMLGTLVQTAQYQGVAVEGASIELEAVTATKPQRVGSIEATLHLPEGLPEAKLPLLVRSASKCKIHNSLVQPPEISMTTRVGDRALAH